MNLTRTTKARSAPPLGPFKEECRMKFPGLKPLLEPLSALQQLMSACGCPWMVIGGVAASLLGKPRFTGDVDIVTLIDDEKKDLAYILKMASRFGFQPRIKDAAAFARNNKVLLLTHTKSAINVDISLGLLPFEQDAIKRRKTRRAGNVILYLPVPEDLIIFKAVAHRPQDMLIFGNHQRSSQNRQKNMSERRLRIRARPGGCRKSWRIWKLYSRKKKTKFVILDA